MTRRVVLIVLSVLLLVVGALVAVAGGTLVAFFSSGGTLRSGSHPLTTSTHALVSPVASIENTRGVRTKVGRPTLTLSAVPRAGSGPVFIGIGPAPAVDKYLAGSSNEVITDFNLDPYNLTTRRQNGTATPPPPGSKQFWVASAQSSSGAANLTWRIHNGGYRVVVMNADSSAGVAVTGRVGVAIPRALPISIAVLVVGLLIIALGVVALVLAMRPVRPKTPPTYRPVAPQAT